MITPRQIERATMTPEKRAVAHYDIIAFYVGRPLSYILTIPFLYTKLTPNQVTILSIVPLVVGFILMYLGDSPLWFYCGWACFFLWNLLDGVDGNIARYRKQFSPMGSVYDAMAGYVAGALTPFAWGVAATHCPGIVQDNLLLPSDLYVVMGGLSAVFTILPRLIMHKAITTSGDGKTFAVNDKKHFDLLKILALNISSCTGFMQVFMLISIPFFAYDLFTITYFFINGLLMIFSLISILKGQ